MDRTLLFFQHEKLLLVPFDTLRKQFHAAHHLTVKILFFQPVKLFFPSGILRAYNIVQVLADTSFLFIVRFPARLCFLPQTVLQFLVNLCVKHFPENFTPVRRSCQQQFLKISLCDHGDLPELTLIQPEKLCHRLCHFRNLRHRLPFIRKNQLRIRFFHRHSLSTVFRPQIFRISLYRIILFLIRKGKLDKGTHFRFCILAAEHIAFADFSTRLSVKCKRDGIKNRRFSRTGISRNQIQATAAQAFKIQFHPVRIRSECAND